MKHQRDGLKYYLGLSTLWHNSTHNESIGMSPFKALYEKEANNFISKPSEDTSNPAVESELFKRQQIRELLQNNLIRSQDKMKKQADTHERDWEFEEGDWVLLKLKLYKQMSLKHHFHHKLSPKFYGPYQIVKKISRVA